MKNSNKEIDKAIKKELTNIANAMGDLRIAFVRLEEYLSLRGGTK